MSARLVAPWIAALVALGCSATHELGPDPTRGHHPVDAAADSAADGAASDEDAASSTVIDGNVPAPDAASPPGVAEAVAAPARRACAFGRGAMPWETLGSELPTGTAIPIDHFVVLVQESRSFDAYFGTMPGVDGLPAGASNPRADGTPVAAHRASAYCFEDTLHDWNAAHAEWHDGANDGFVTASDPGGERAMAYLAESDLPYYRWLASTFAISDRHFASVLAPTFPNREYLFSASSFGRIDNMAPDTARTSGADGDRIILQALDRAGVSWGVYYETVPFLWGAYPTWALEPAQRHRAHAFSELFRDLASGSVPSVIWVDPSWTASGTTTHDEHPPADPQFGQAWVRDVITHVMASPLWSRTAIVLTYSQSGGLYDHVPPPEACPPGDYPPIRTAADAAGDFDRLGLRVPLVVVSPYTRPGYVSHEVTDHTSILRLIEARFGLPALSARDANAWPLLDMFDFGSAPFATPPPAPGAPIDEAHRAACAAAF